MDVVTQGGFIEDGTPIRVLRVDDNQIVVEEADAEGGGDGQALPALDRPPLLALVLPLAQGDGGVSLGVLALLVIVGLGLVRPCPSSSSGGGS